VGQLIKVELQLPLAFMVEKVAFWGYANLMEEA